MSWPTRPKDTGQEAHNRGGLESNLVNRASVEIAFGSGIVITDWIFQGNPTHLSSKRSGREGLNPTNHNTLTHTGHKAFILTEARTYLNLHVPCGPLFSGSVSTHTLKSSHKIQHLGP
jgi:hypothetical protein